MTRRHQIRTLVALGISGPLLVGLGIGGVSQAIADPAASTGTESSAVGTEATSDHSTPSDVFTTGSKEFADPSDTTLGAKEVAEDLYGYAADPSLSDAAECTSGLDMGEPGDIATCTVTGWSGAEETYYAYIAPGATADADYWLYYSEDAPLPKDAVSTLNDGLNGTGAYPAWGEEQEQRTHLTKKSAVERANFVLDGFGRDDLTVTSVESEMDLTSLTPVRGTATEEGSGRRVGVTLLPVPTEGEAPAMLVSIDGP
jgi:hypothetical protein